MLERRKLKQKKKKKKENLRGKIDRKKNTFSLASSWIVLDFLLAIVTERASERANKTGHAVFSSACLKRKEKPFPRREDDFLSRPISTNVLFYSVPFDRLLDRPLPTTAFSTSVSSKTTLSRTGYSRTWWREREIARDHPECGRRKRNKMESVQYFLPFPRFSLSFAFDSGEEQDTVEGI